MNECTLKVLVLIMYEFNTVNRYTITVSSLESYHLLSTLCVD